MSRGVDDGASWIWTRPSCSLISSVEYTPHASGIVRVTFTPSGPGTASIRSGSPTMYASPATSRFMFSTRRISGWPPIGDRSRASSASAIASTRASTPATTFPSASRGAIGSADGSSGSTTPIWRRSFANASPVHRTANFTSGVSSK
jgi:hypothetical protein